MPPEPWLSSNQSKWSFKEFRIQKLSFRCFPKMKPKVIEKSNFRKKYMWNEVTLNFKTKKDFTESLQIKLSA